MGVDGTVLFDRLRPLIEAGDRVGVVRFFADMSEADRRSLVRPLRAYAKTAVWDGVQPGEDWLGARDRWNRRQSPILIAGCAVISPAPAVAKWVAGRRFNLTWGTWPIRECRQILAERDPAWLAELPEALCAAQERPDRETWKFVNALAELAGVEMSVSVNYAYGWADTIRRMSGAIETVVDTVRADPRHTEFLPMLFEAEDGDELFRATGPIRRVTLLLAAEGGPLRTAVLDAVLRRLLRGGRQGAMRDRAAFWSEFAVTDTEVAERIGSCISLLSSEYGFVVKEFLAVVKRASDAGVLDVETALEAVSVVLTRPEKYLVKTGLSWVDALSRKHPERIGELVTAAASAFGNPAADVQERAVKVVTKQADKISGDDRQRLNAEARLLLPPDLVAVVVDALGQKGDRAATGASGDTVQQIDVTDVVHPEIAPYQPRPMPRPIGSPAELAEEYTRLITEGPTEAMDLERVLAAFVEFAATDREGLRSAMAPVSDRYPPGRWWGWGAALTPRMALFRLAEAAVAPDKPSGAKRPTFLDLWTAGATQHVNSTMSPAHLIAVRIAELAAVLGGEAAPPRLLATPTDVTGVVDPKVLRERLLAAESEGWQPLEADFHQALLRMPSDCGGVDATALTSEFGLVFGDWCDGERVTLPETRRTAHHTGYDWDQPSAWRTFKAFDAKPPASPESLLDVARCVWSRPGHPVHDGSVWPACWPALLPSRPDLVVTALARQWPGDGDPLIPALLAEADVPDHDALHFLLARCLADPAPAVRAGAVDAALLLASRGKLTGTLLGGDLADALRDPRLVGLRKTVPGLRDLANGGAARAAWDCVAVLLDQALPPAVPKTLTGTGELLALATELADALDVRGPIAGVSALAAKKGGGPVQSGARRLAAVLGRD